MYHLNFVYKKTQKQIEKTNEHRIGDLPFKLW